MNVQYKKLREQDIDEAAALLTAAFQNSPFYRYIVPDAAERLNFLRLNFEERLRGGLGRNDIEAALIGARIAGIAVWIPPAPDPSASPPEAALGEAFKAFSPGIGERFFAFLKTLHDARDLVISQPFWSLAPIAVLPEEQGKGIARGLIRRKLVELDAAALPCFLGTQDRINLTIYGNYGFKLLREDPLAPPEIFHYTMLRKPLAEG
ncbi:MAG: hypothetical protein LBQ38_06905 [Spirochaetaceae bacterium]|jgi:predicted N-acetyltransferase YhbS|nr:hypothetical protein [Spirochaetaceae bacterium]